ncbi:MAG TPA: hypothetical protein VFR09_08570 [Alphaproteobacteria bacterium]|nr:hypothetical protein [Alphaproteobacteria bacterium]
MSGIPEHLPLGSFVFVVADDDAIVKGRLVERIRVDNDTSTSMKHADRYIDSRTRSGEWAFVISFKHCGMDIFGTKEIYANRYAARQGIKFWQRKAQEKAAQALRPAA